MVNKPRPEAGLQGPRNNVLNRLGARRLAPLLALALPLLPAWGGSFSTDFNSGLPAGTAVHGVATVDSSGGYTNSGCLKLTTATGSVQGSFIITDDLDAGLPVVGFTASFKAYVGGGTGADGFSFNFAPDLPADGNFAEEGAGSGLTVAFDTFANDATGGSDLAGIDVKVNGTQMATFPWAGLRKGTWVDVIIQWRPDGKLNVFYDDLQVYTNLDVGSWGFTSITAGHFGFGSRTGGSTDNHWIDNLSITTYTTPAAFIDTFKPIGRAVRADAPVAISLKDHTYYDPSVGNVSSTVDTSSIILKLDGAAVTPSITHPSADSTDVRYTSPALFAPSSLHTANISFVASNYPTAAPAGYTLYTNTFAYSFTVADYSTLPTNLIASPALVSANPGFAIRVSQIDAHLGQTIARAESQLAGLLIDPTTGLPYANLATPNPADGSFNFTESGTINYSTTGSLGDFPTELAASIPGLPGTTGGDTNAALEAVTYLYLLPGMYTLSVNSSDGFALTAASTPDLFAPQEAIFNGVRSNGVTTVTFSVAQGGYYPFRLCYFVGGIEMVNPSADVPSLEFYSVDAEGNRTLINDATAPSYIHAYRPAQTLPYIRSVSPTPGLTGVPHGAAIDAALVNGTITIQPATIELQLNGVVVTPTLASSGGVTTVHYQPASLALNSTNLVQIAFTDSLNNRRTNTYSFVVENVLTLLWQILPDSSSDANWYKYITSGSTERGVAYNPKTGHVLLASRSNRLPGFLGVAILDGNTGAFLGAMDTIAITNSGVGTYKLNMIDVAEDGVIYGCNLTTSGTVAFQVWRWQNETAAPELVYNANPIGGATRCGDDFTVRGSGAGTLLLASGNSSVTTVPIFSTGDGTNFIGTALNVANLPANSVRLGLAFGCGKTFYGTTTATPMQNASFDGPPSTVASRTAAYDIRDLNGTQNIGPIGVDVANQRLIGNGTSQTTGTAHTMNLYDLEALATSGQNKPIDAKVFPTKNGNYGTGAIDFSPDGTRVYTVDTANGMIAFSLAPKPAAPTICGQPQNFFLPAVNTGTNVGFMDVSAIGSLQTYQWRLNGANILNATNRTVDIYAVRGDQLGWYSVVITNALGSATSAPALLDVQMSLTTQPTDQIINRGDTLNLTVAATGGYGAYTYAWTHYGTNIPGATGPTLTIPNAQVSDAGFYAASVTDGPGQKLVSTTAVVNVLIPPGPTGSGTGLLGLYYTNANYGNALYPPDAFSGQPALTRTDSNISFDWGSGSPDLNLPVDYFSVRWVGQVQPLYSQTYYFYGRSDDGQRLWVNGQLLIDNWVAQAPTENSGSIALEAGKTYDLIYEFFERGGGAVAQLSWWSASQVKAIIPMEQLYPAASWLPPAITLTSPANGANYTTAAVPLAATVVTNQNVLTKVQFFANATNLIGEATSAPFAATWSGGAAGTWSITARAVYNIGSFVDSTASTITTVALSPSHISGMQVTAGSSTISGTGATGQTFVLLNATNLASPVVWRPVATNDTGTGTFSFTVPVGTMCESYFRVQSR